MEENEVNEAHPNEGEIEEAVEEADSSDASDVDPSGDEELEPVENPDEDAAGE